MNTDAGRAPGGEAPSTERRVVTKGEMSRELSCGSSPSRGHGVTIVAAGEAHEQENARDAAASSSPATAPAENVRCTTVWIGARSAGSSGDSSSTTVLCLRLGRSAVGLPVSVTVTG